MIGLHEVLQQTHEVVLYLLVSGIAASAVVRVVMVEVESLGRRISRRHER